MTSHLTEISKLQANTVSQKEKPDLCFINTQKAGIPSGKAPQQQPLENDVSSAEQQGVKQIKTIITLLNVNIDYYDS